MSLKSVLAKTAAVSVGVGAAATIGGLGLISGFGEDSAALRPSVILASLFVFNAGYALLK
jgi:hypothetical protein